MKRAFPRPVSKVSSRSQGDAFWKKSENPKEGGGTYAIIKNGTIFDSVGINFSEVSGKFQKKFRFYLLK